MQDSDYLFCFLKFGRETDMLDLIDNGTLYMKPIDEFRKMEDNNFLRGDQYEGISKVWNLPAGEFEIPSINYKGNYISLHLRESYEKVLGNLYCLFCISSDGFKNPKDFFIDQRVKGFGSHCVCIRDLNEFTRRVRRKLKELGYYYELGFVDYYDRNKINGEVTVFQKRKEFEYQKEFRFYVYQKIIAPLRIQIGSIRDIAEMGPATAIDEIKMFPTVKPSV
jgi:hypothetical protein